MLRVDSTHDIVADVTYEPWTDGVAVGYRATHNRTGVVEYIYLNPSIGSDDDVPTVFVYLGSAGDSASDDVVLGIATGNS